MISEILTVAVGVVALTISSIGFADEWKWSGLEIIGSHSVSKEKISDVLPIKLGDPYKEDAKSWSEWCEKIRSQFNFYYTQCSSTRYIDFKAYFVVNIVEVGDEYRTKYRAAPTKTVSATEPSVFDLYDQLMKRLWELFGKGINAGETVNGDFLDFKDPQMHAMVLKLLEKTPATRENLIEILGNEKDSKKRSAAAWLLCWALQPTDSIGKVFKWLDDPDGDVRNDISRFMFHWISELKNPGIEKSLIDALVLQMKRPSFADRNKSLTNLQFYLKSHPSSISYFKTVGKVELDYIAANSVLENVGGVAKEIQKLLR